MVIYGAYRQRIVISEGCGVVTFSMNFAAKFLPAVKMLHLKFKRGASAPLLNFGAGDRT